jgi:hypothetical protein
MSADLVNVTRGVSTPTLVEVFGTLVAGDTVMRRGAEDVVAGDVITPMLVSGRNARP